MQFYGKHILKIAFGNILVNAIEAVEENNAEPSTENVPVIEEVLNSEVQQ